MGYREEVKDNRSDLLQNAPLHPYIIYEFPEAGTSPTLCLRRSDGEAVDILYVGPGARD